MVLEKNDAQKELAALSSPEDNLKETAVAGKKPFIEPEISLPVDVLEATTFLQAVDTGPTN